MYTVCLLGSETEARDFEALTLAPTSFLAQEPFYVLPSGQTMLTLKKNSQTTHALEASPQTRSDTSRHVQTRPATFRLFAFSAFSQHLARTSKNFKHFLKNEEINSYFCFYCV